MSEKLWVNCLVEEKRECREWSKLQTAVLRAYKRGELNGIEYRMAKLKLADELDRIERKYRTDLGEENERSDTSKVD